MHITFWRMTAGEGVHPAIGRKTPAGGAHVIPGQPNIFFVTVLAKDRSPWLAQEQVQACLVELWRKEAAAWRVGFYLLMPDHLHFFCAPFDLRFGIDDWMSFWKSQLKRRNLDQPWEWQRRAFHRR